MRCAVWDAAGVRRYGVVDMWCKSVASCIWFFFSSRRRHTRLQGDWSSDVCSSDLSVPEIVTWLETAAPAPSLLPVPGKPLIGTIAALIVTVGAAPAADDSASSASPDRKSVV